MTKRKIELPADQYDTLEFVSMLYGGIGADHLRTYKRTTYESMPLCLYGMIEFSETWDSWSNFVAQGFSTDENDKLVRRVNKAKNRPSTARISWAEYTKAANIVRTDNDK